MLGDIICDITTHSVLAVPVCDKALTMPVSHAEAAGTAETVHPCLIPMFHFSHHACGQPVVTKYDLPCVWSAHSMTNHESCR